MKTKILSILVFAAVIATGAAPPAQAQPCSNAMLKGTYGFHAFATNLSSGSPGTPRAIIGIFTLDGQGTVTGNLTINDNGTITKTGSQTGTYVVNADCTGTLFNLVELVVVDGGKEFYQMRISPPTSLRSAQPRGCLQAITGITKLGCWLRSSRPE
jgi:hypothetical protein